MAVWLAVAGWTLAAFMTYRWVRIKILFVRYDRQIHATLDAMDARRDRRTGGGVETCGRDRTSRN